MFGELDKHTLEYFGVELGDGGQSWSHSVRGSPHQPAFAYVVQWGPFPCAVQWTGRCFWHQSRGYVEACWIGRFGKGKPFLWVVEVGKDTGRAAWQGGVIFLQ